MSESIEQEQDQDRKESTTLEHFGALLKEAREKKGLNIQSVASSLRLNSDLIKALENNDVDKLPSKIFVMGYLRSYARLLNVDESKLEQLDLSEISQTVDVKTSYSSKPEKNSKHLSVRLVTYLVSGGMVILLALWWLSMQTDFRDIAISGDYQQGDSAAGTTLALPENSDLRSIDSEVVEGIEPPAMVAAEESAPVEKPAVQAEPPTQAASSEVASVTPATAVVETEQAAPVEEPVAQSELKLTYLEDSWSEVSDADDNRLLYGLYKKGREITLQGVAPFSLFFGYAPGVVVTHNEEQFDHIPFHRNGVARFQVGSAEDNHLPSEN